MPPPARRRRSARRRDNITADQVVADQIRTLRERRGMSQQRLADLLGETQSTVARIESGKRTIAVGELLRIAWALDVAPVHLLAASFQPEAVPIQNSIRLAPSDMREWVRGETPIPGGDNRAYFDNISEEEWAERQASWEVARRLRNTDPEVVTLTREGVVDYAADQLREQEDRLERGDVESQRQRWALTADEFERFKKRAADRKSQMDASKQARADADRRGKRSTDG